MWIFPECGCWKNWNTSFLSWKFQLGFLFDTEDKAGKTGNSNRQQYQERTCALLRDTQ
jgi:hypothetical protein